MDDNLLCLDTTSRIIIDCVIWLLIFAAFALGYFVGVHQAMSVTARRLKR